MLPVTERYLAILKQVYPLLDSSKLALSIFEAAASQVGLDRARTEGFGPQDFPLDQRSALLICYGDSLLPGQAPTDPMEAARAALGLGGGVDQDGKLLPAEAGEGSSLKTLKEFADRYLKGIFSGIHILPFFPYSSDDGFSILDYLEVNPKLGGWEEIESIGEAYQFMADLVLNHCSAKGPWFQAYLRGDPEFADFFIDLPPDSDVSMVVRPRTHPLLTPFEGKDSSGKDVTRHIWTTFSEDQVDLNFANPKVLVEMVRVLFHLIKRGTRIVRLDAVAYTWKELGSDCIHHPNTHALVKLLRMLVDDFAPGTVLITETNVPHDENLSYFGTGRDEAHMIYQFSLPPLILHSFLTGSAKRMSEWAREIEVLPAASYFNFASSHDGVGLTPAHGILDNDELEQLVSNARSRGAAVNYKSSSAGDIPYELTATYFSILDNPVELIEDRVARFLASQAVLLVMPGVPGIYIHSLFASQNFHKGRELSGANRTLNREKLFVEDLKRELQDQLGLRSRVYRGMAHMLRTRREQEAFHPLAAMQVLDLGVDEIFAIKRFSERQELYCLINTTGFRTRVLPPVARASRFVDILSGNILRASYADDWLIAPWGVLWLSAQV